MFEIVTVSAVKSCNRKGESFPKPHRRQTFVEGESISRITRYKNDPQLNEPYKWDGDAVFQSRLFFRDNQNLVAQLKRENSELDSNDIDFSQTDPNTQVKIKTF